jgi:predicted TPR repeat methyltransferase
VVLACQPVDLNIVLEREPGSAGRFDLVVATNVFVYYSALEQGLALQNVANMLKPGGVFLSNTELPRLPEAPIRSIGRTSARYTQDAGDQIIWYQRL